MNFDISKLLNEWEYQAGQIVVRKFLGQDGKEKIQLRVDLGVLQMNAFGRPDGKQPFGHETLLDHFEARLKKHRANHDEGEESFKLNAEECSKLQQEAIQFHHRYICLYQLQDYAGVVRDTERNIRVFDFVDKHAEAPEMAWALQQLRPQLLMMHTRARGMIALNSGHHDKAISMVEEGLERIRAYFRDHARPDLIDQSGEIQSLELWLEEIRSTRPVPEKERIEKALDDAIQREDYEQAAKLRDSLRKLGVDK